MLPNCGYFQILINCSIILQAYLDQLANPWYPYRLGGETGTIIQPSFLRIVVQSLSCVQLFVTPWTGTCQASLSFTISWSLPKLMFIELVMPSNHLILCCPLLLLPSIFPRIRVFSSELAVRIRWSKYWSFSISPSNEYSGLIFFRIDGFDLLAVQGTLKSLLEHQKLKIISSSELSLFYFPALTSLHDYWKNHNFYQSNPCFLCSCFPAWMFSLVSCLTFCRLPTVMAPTSGWK